MLSLRGSAPNIFISRAESHDVGGEVSEPSSGGVEAGGEERTTASHEKGGGDSLIRFSLSVMVQACYVVAASERYSES